MQAELTFLGSVRPREMLVQRRLDGHLCPGRVRRVQRSRVLLQTERESGKKKEVRDPRVIRMQACTLLYILYK